MHAGCGNLTTRIKAGHRGAPALVDRDAAHVIVCGGNDRNRLLQRIDAMRATGRKHRRKMLRQFRAQRARIEKGLTAGGAEKIATTTIRPRRPASLVIAMAPLAEPETSKTTSAPPDKVAVTPDAPP